MPEQEIIDDVIVEGEDNIAVDGDTEADKAPALEPKKDDSVDSSAEDDEERQRKKRKRSGSNQARIKELWQREQDNKARIAALEQEKQATNEKIGKFQEIAVTNAEANLVAQRKLLEQELRLAHESADSEKIAKITSHLGQIHADEAQVKRFKMENYIDGAPKQPAAKPVENDAPPISTIDDLYENGTISTKKWLDENRAWFDGDSDEFDEEKASDVTDFARNLERKLVAQGRAEEIQTSSYYRRINEYIKENWSNDDGAEPVTERKTFNRATPSAAPVNGRTSSAGQAAQKKAVTITTSERDLAVSLNLRHPNGTDYTDAEKIKAYISGRNQPR